MAGLSPTQRTLRELKQQGRIAAIVEKFNSFVGPYGIRQDLWGFGDLLVLDSDKVGVTAVQCCSRSGHAAHRTKILENEIAPEFLKCGNRIELWSWGKQKVRLKSGGYGKAMRWVPKVEEITLDDFFTD